MAVALVLPSYPRKAQEFLRGNLRGRPEGRPHVLRSSLLAAAPGQWQGEAQPLAQAGIPAVSLRNGQAAASSAISLGPQVERRLEVPSAGRWPNVPTNSLRIGPGKAIEGLSDLSNVRTGPNATRTATPSGSSG